MNMDYDKLSVWGDWGFAAGGGALVFVSIFRFAFSEPFSVMPRFVYILSIELFSMGLFMIFMGIRQLKLVEFMNILRLFFGKGLYCLFVTGFLIVCTGGYSNALILVYLIFCLMSLGYIAIGVLNFNREIDTLSSYRK